MRNLKEVFVSTIRRFLHENNLEYIEYESKFGSVYFRVNLDNNANPCIRVSDHSVSKDTHVNCNFNYAMVGKNARIKDIQKRIEKGLKRLIKRSSIYSFNKALKKINA